MQFFCHLPYWLQCNLRFSQTMTKYAQTREEWGEVCLAEVPGGFPERQIRGCSLGLTQELQRDELVPAEPSLEQWFATLVAH